MAKGNLEPAVLEALYRISSLLGKTDSPEEALEAIVDEMLSVLPATSASIDLLNPDTRTLEMEALRGMPERSKQLQLSLGQGVTGWVALHGKPLLVPDVSKDSRYVPAEPTHDTIRCEMAVPMRDRGTVIGVINMDSDQEGSFREEHLTTLSLLSAEAGRVISRIWDMRRLQRKSQQLQALVETSRSLVARLDMGELLSTIANEALRLTEHRLCALFLYDSRDNRLKLETLAGTRTIDDYVETLHIEESAIGTAIRRRKQVEVADLPRSEEHHFVEIVQREGLVSMLASPLIFEDEVVGVLNLYTDSRHRFSNEERDLIAALTGISALAILNARLYKRVFQTEETLRRSDRLTTLGLLSAEIAHEIRNPLTVIKLLFGSMDLEFDEDDMRRRDVEVITEKLDQLESIVSRVLSFGKTNEGLHARYNLQQLVDDTLHLVRMKLEQGGVQLDYQACEDPILVDVSKTQLQQAVLNLVINATQAMPEGGRIEVRIGQEEREEQPVGYVTISDTGNGIPPEIEANIFDSFLTGHAKGTGLGLNISKRILKSHNGDIEIVKTGPDGTTIKLWLPAVDPS